MIGVPGGGPVKFVGTSARSAVAVSAPSCVSVGRASTPTWPVVRREMSGSVPVFGPVPSPFAASHTRAMPSLVTSVSVGYPAVGTRPRIDEVIAFGRYPGAGQRALGGNLRWALATPLFSARSALLLD